MMSRYLRPLSITTKYYTQVSYRSFSCYPPTQQSIFDSAKQKLDEINHKVGKVAADTLDKAGGIAEEAKEKAHKYSEQAHNATESLKKKGTEKYEHFKDSVDKDSIPEEVYQKREEFAKWSESAKEDAKEAAKDLSGEVKKSFKEAKEEAEKRFD